MSNNPFIAVVGGANIDIHGSPLEALRMNDSNPGTVRISSGGVARNIAENLARLEIDCRLISAIGNDQNGQMLLQHAQDAGIDMRHSETIAALPTSTYLSVLDHAGDMYVAISDMAIMSALGTEQLQTHATMLKQAALIVIDTNLDDDALAWLAETFSDDVLFVDTVSTTKARKIKPYLHAVHTLKPGLTEAEAIAGLKADSDRQLAELASWFHDRGVQRLFITLGDKGVFYSADGKQGIEKPSFKSMALRNAGGAGDAFLSGLAYSWINDWPLERSIQFGLAAASLTMSHELSNHPNLSISSVQSILENPHVN